MHCWIFWGGGPTAIVTQLLIYGRLLQIESWDSDGRSWSYGNGKAGHTASGLMNLQFCECFIFVFVSLSLRGNGSYGEGDQSLLSYTSMYLLNRTLSL